MRLHRFTRVRGLIVLFGGLTAGFALLATGGFEKLSGAGGVLGMALSALVMIVVGAAKYPRSAGTPSHEQVVSRLLRDRKKYCLILRPFGQDAEIVLPKTGAKRRTGGGPFTRNVTMEQLITSAARTVLDMDTYGIVDQRTTFAPPGPVLMRAADDEWQEIAQRLIGSAHVIVLILPPDRDFGDGFVWEIEQIRQAGATSRVVIVLPPCDQDTEAYEAALRRACVLLALLDGELDHFKVHEYELMLPTGTLVIRSTADGAKWWQTLDEPVERTMVGRKRKTVVADMTYLDVLEVALREIDHEQS
ncbi:hypothetical protein [Lentzea aerocolonigenes]|uniref:hypothetical protein n=1 Tax=Lentzea aerocolonigenes TaxID=68170 RepID=UPI000B219946|nr:hypothetical protein [Lentzea aerocolonigenes]MCP2244024.1 hypothetical protein [Lentzea aerocolonigenes]